MTTLGHHWANIRSTRLAGLSFMPVTELLINGVIRVWQWWWRWLSGIFLPFWCHFPNSKENWFATTKPASFNKQATATYQVTCSLIEMINMLVWVQVCTYPYLYNLRSDDSIILLKCQSFIKVGITGLTSVRACAIYTLCHRPVCA